MTPTLVLEAAVAAASSTFVVEAEAMVMEAHLTVTLLVAKVEEVGNFEKFKMQTFVAI